MKKLLLGLLMAFATTVSAQADFGVIAAGSEYAGDLAKNPFVLSETQLGGSIFFRYHIDDQFTVKVSGSMGRIAGEDSNKSTSANRNMHFRSLIKEFAVQAGYDFGDIYVDDFVPYIQAGLGVFHHNPQAERNGTWIALQPLGTEGQGIPGYGDKYDLVQFSVPFGGGVKWKMNENIILSVDYGARKTFTDHLDDISRLEYVPASILIQNGPDAVDLAYHADEIGGRPYSDFESANVRATDVRNLSQKKDWYYLIGIGGSYYLPFFGDRDRNPIKRNRKRVPYRL